MTDTQSEMNSWREHFYSPLNGDQEPEIGEKVWIAVARLKNNKASETDGSLFGLFKHGKA